MAETTAKRAGELVRKVFEILIRHSDGLPAREVLMATEPVTLTRREFLIGTAAAGAGFSLGLYLPFASNPAAAAERPPEVNAWVVIQPDDTVVIRIARSEMGLGTLLGRYILKRRGKTIRVVTFGPLIAILVGAALFAGILAWGQGENLYVLYLDSYRLFFGSGT